VGCLVPLRQVVAPYELDQEYTVVLLTTGYEEPLTAMRMALVRDCLLGADQGRLRDASSQPHWVVADENFYVLNFNDDYYKRTNICYV
jgi:hypothetical protein